MSLTPVDWAVISGYFLFNLAIGFYYRSRAGRSTNEFFLSGRNAPWWLVGTSMVATTFAADTPLAVTGTGGAQRHRGELALVERGGERHAPSPVRILMKDGVRLAPGSELPPVGRRGP